MVWDGPGWSGMVWDGLGWSGGEQQLISTASCVLLGGFGFMFEVGMWSAGQVTVVIAIMSSVALSFCLKWTLQAFFASHGLPFIYGGGCAKSDSVQSHTTLTLTQKAAFADCRTVAYFVSTILASRIPLKS